MDLERSKFIKKIANDAINATAGTGLFPSLLIAQACLEGNNGRSALALKYNNHFGIKKFSWSGAYVDFKSYEYIGGIKKLITSSFRVYASLYDGFKDRCNFLMNNSRYKTAGVFVAKTPEAQAQALQKAGYATDPKYASLLNGIIATYNLKQYDLIAQKKKINANRFTRAFGWFTS